MKVKGKVFFDRIGRKVIMPEGRTAIKRSSAYGIYIIDGKVLLHQPRWSPLWELPGGGIEEGEDAESGLKREFFEETGHRITQLNARPLIRKTQNFYSEDKDIYYLSNKSYLQVLDATKEKEPDPDDTEVKKIEWVQASELNKANCKSEHLEIIRKLLSKDI